MKRLQITINPLNIELAPQWNFYGRFTYFSWLIFNIEYLKKDA